MSGTVLPKTMWKASRSSIGARFAPQSSDPFAYAIGYPASPVDDLLVFHIVFGKTVPDVSLNAVANLGYADCRFLRAVYPGDTLTAASEVIGLRENSSRKTGVVYLRSSGFKQDGTKVLDYVRWVMVRKRDPEAFVPTAIAPVLPAFVEPARLVVPAGLIVAEAMRRTGEGEIVVTRDDHRTGFAEACGIDRLG